MSQSEYYFMNRDCPVLLFKLEETIGGYRAKELERYQEKLPVGFEDINTWIDQRNYAKHKEHLVKWIHEWNIDNMKGFIEITHGLGLNDSLWVKKADSDLMWNDINLYDNNFDDVVSKTAFEKGLHGLQLSTTSPEFTSEGSFAKCWIRENNEIYLYKKGSEGFANAGLEPYSEFYSSELAEKICKSSVSYSLIQYKGSLCSRCSLFTSQDEGFVPIYRYLNASKSYQVQDILEFCDKLGFEDEFRRMIVLDSVIFNVDRHTGNFGFIVDNASYEIKRFAPVFDHNMSLLCRAMDSDFANIDQYIKQCGHKMGGDFTEVAKKITTPEINSILRELLDYEFPVNDLYHLDQKRLEILNSCVTKEIRAIIHSGQKRILEIGR